MLNLQITTGSETPLFRQIVDQVRSAVVHGRLKVGDPLPSVRGLAAELVLNHNTVAKAYAQLVREGVIESQQGRGYFVVERRVVYTKAERRRRINALIAPLVAEAVMLGFSADEIQVLLQKQLDKVQIKGDV